MKKAMILAVLILSTVMCLCACSSKGKKSESNVTEKSSETKATSASETSTESKAESVSEISTESRAESVSESSTESSEETVGENATESSEESVVETSTESSEESVAENSTESSEESVAENSTESKTESVSESITETAAESTTEKSADSADEKEKPVVRFSSKQFSESRIVAEVYALALEDAGVPIERMFGVAAIQEAIAAGEIDIYPEYTGTGLTVVLGLDPLYDAQEVYDTVKKGYAEKLDITWLDYAEANDGEGLVIRTDVAEKLNIYTISDLQKHAGEIRIATQGEFEEREDGQKALEKVYGPFEWKSLTVYSDALKYTILESNEADVAPAYTTEAYLTLPQFTLLEDDKHVWPPYNIAPIVRNEILEAYPEIADVCNAVSKTLTTEVVTSLNARVDLDGEEPSDVARDFYETTIKK